MNYQKESFVCWIDHTEISFVISIIFLSKGNINNYTSNNLEIKAQDINK